MENGETLLELVDFVAADADIGQSVQKVGQVVIGSAELQLRKQTLQIIHFDGS